MPHLRNLIVEPSMASQACCLVESGAKLLMSALLMKVVVEREG